MTISYTYSGGAADVVAPPGARGWWRRRQDARTDIELAMRAVIRWRWAAEGCLGQAGSTAAGIPHVAIPKVRHVVLGYPGSLYVELLAGQVPADIAAVSDRLAEAMNVAAIRVEPAGRGFAWIRLLHEDPLGDVMDAVAPITSAFSPVILGRKEDGAHVAVDLVSAAHLIIQGATGSGKSVFAYSLLGQLVDAKDVVVTGSDPTGLLLAPWMDRSTAGIPALGTRNAQAHVQLLERVVAEMDRRITAMPMGRDAVELGPTCPLLVVVLEEYPGLLRLLDAIDPKGFAKTARACVARLLSEARKAGIRLVIMAQRADATIIGGYERGQASHKISFRVDNSDAVRMLHPHAPADVIADHATAVPGVALLSAPGEPLTRFRGPYVPYAEYIARVAE